MKPVFCALAWVGVAAGLPGVRGDSPKAAPDPLPPAAPGAMDFARDIKPILDRACVRCHFSPQPSGTNRRSDRGGFSLSTRVRALAGGDAMGVVIVPGRSAESPLIALVAGVPHRKTQVPAMPPREADRLSPREVGMLRAWIDQGAVWPE